MKYVLLFLMIASATGTIAQKKRSVVKVNTIASLEKEIEKELKNVLITYSNKSNTQATWALIKAEAQNILYRYFRNGRLMGSKAEEAYFVKMGIETMTATDIANHKMILLAGIALVKPGEFELLRIEK